PLVCFAYNADFDGDQMAVHVPLSYEAVAEARQVLLSTKNLLSPSDGEPVVAPTLDMVLGCYYMTFIDPSVPPSTAPRKAFSGYNAVQLGYQVGQVKIHDAIRFRLNGVFIDTTVGRVLFNEIVPDSLGFQNELMDKKKLRELVSLVHQELSEEETVRFVDAIKDMGFRYATQSGITMASSDIQVPRLKPSLMAEADQKIEELEEQYQMGLVTNDEKYMSTINIWTETTNRIQQALVSALEPSGSLAMMSTSGAKGNIAQIRQMGGMRGLMSDPSGRIIPLPIRSSFRDGLSVLEYFISTHGARKGLADTALRTADSGYLTRRMIDVSQDVVVNQRSCVPEGDPIPGIWLRERAEAGLLAGLLERMIGRWSASAVAHPETGEIIVEAGDEITELLAQQIMEVGVEQVHVRSPLTCQLKRGICQTCYGRSLATGRLVEEGVAIGIIAAQSIGEPGTQLTMRTFHTGGVAGGHDITSGLPRVEEIFEARVPKGQATLSEIDGVVQVNRTGDQRVITVTSTDTFTEEYELPENFELLVEDGDRVDEEQVLAQPPEGDEGSTLPAVPLLAIAPGVVQFVRDGRRRRPTMLRVTTEVVDARDYPIAANARVRIESGEYVQAGRQLTEGSLDPQDVLEIMGPEACQLYLTDEVQKVYRSQGVNINDRHIEVIVRQMMRKVRVEDPGDSELLPTELLDRWSYEDLNAKIVVEGGTPATAVPVLLGVTKASLSTDSFLAAASFQETTRVLTDAALEGKTDHLRGLKENVIIGKLIPARAQITVERPTPIAEIAMPESLLLPFIFDFERQELIVGETPSVFQPSADMTAELAGAGSYVAEPE
ncbi:MAG: DNA-directed RNA polymerase subunit beta', partial [Chloroflexi bacterium]|nr:DNA-directed RNA polymerase subunit beta' [Chloroflexota bacterium]